MSGRLTRGTRKDRTECIWMHEVQRRGKTAIYVRRSGLYRRIDGQTMPQHVVRQPALHCALRTFLIRQAGHIRLGNGPREGSSFQTIVSFFILSFSYCSLVYINPVNSVTKIIRSFPPLSSLTVQFAFFAFSHSLRFYCVSTSTSRLFKPTLLRPLIPAILRRFIAHFYEIQLQHLQPEALGDPNLAPLLPLNTIRRPHFGHCGCFCIHLDRRCIIVISFPPVDEYPNFLGL